MKRKTILGKCLFYPLLLFLLLSFLFSSGLIGDQKQKTKEKIKTQIKAKSKIEGTFSPKTFNTARLKVSFKYIEDTGTFTPKTIHSARLNVSFKYVEDTGTFTPKTIRTDRLTVSFIEK